MELKQKIAYSILVMFSLITVCFIQIVFAGPGYEKVDETHFKKSSSVERIDTLDALVSKQLVVQKKLDDFNIEIATVRQLGVKESKDVPLVEPDTAPVITENDVP